MLKGDCISVDFSDFVPADFSGTTETGKDFCHHPPLARDWGTIQAKSLVLPNAIVTVFDVDVSTQVQVRHQREEECTTVNSCFCLEGKVTTQFTGIRKRLSLRKGLQNFIYKPYTDDCHYLDDHGPLRLFHISIDRLYYLQLLDENMSWCGKLKDRIERKELVAGYSEEMLITPVMHRIIHDIMYCPLTGPLGKIIMEAKILELTAYQLSQFASIQTQERHGCIREHELDSFYDLKKYLEQYFDREHSLKSLSKEFGINEYKLKKGFRELFGSTVFEFIHNLRMNHAKNLIQDCGFTICEVAGRIGYKNPNHFSVAFKKQFGFSPSYIRA